MSNTIDCPICGFPGCNEDSLSSRSWQQIYCEDCGKFYLHNSWSDFSERVPPDTPFKMACLLYQKKLQGKTDPIAFYFDIPWQEKPQAPYSFPCYECKEWIKSFPADPLVKIDQVLLNLKNHVGENFAKSLSVPTSTAFKELSGDETEVQLKHRTLAKMMFCKDYHSAQELTRLMCEMGYADKDRKEVTINGRTISRIDGFRLKTTAEGWQRISELQDQQTENSETYFVAMAFNESTNEYREAVRNAVKQAGYRADEIAVDEAHHNNFIMDKIINLINEARFVIADFTTMPEEPDGEKTRNGVRGGVYWEAGYARGLGKEVIHTCRDDPETLRRLHFDIQQINTLRWNEDTLEQFTENLTERIKATVGKGPLLNVN